jgi:CheY-like chemotaxis protein/CHASE3 domain sensor protein
VPIQQRSRALLPTKSFLAIAISVAVVFAIGTLSYRSLTARGEAVRAVARANAIKQTLSDLLSTLKDLETGQRGYVITGDVRHLAIHDDARTQLPLELARLRAVFGGAHALEIDQLAQLVDRRIAILARGIELKRAGNDEAAFAVVRAGEGRAVMEAIRKLVAAMIADEESQLAMRTTEWDDTVRWSNIVVYGGLSLLLVAVLLIGYFASRDFRTVENEGWIRRVQLALGEAVQGDLKVESVGHKALGVLVENVGAQVGAIYVTEGDGLRRIAAHAIHGDGAPEQLALGEGLVGQAAKERRVMHLRDLPEDYLLVRSTTGGTRTRELAIIPAIVDGTVHAVLELGFLHHVDAAEQAVLDRVAELLGIAVRSARDRSRLENLLEETQRQAEELQAQQEELRVTNEELEQQSRTLQLSQTQLENQQSELEQINSELEQQSASVVRQRDELARAGAELQRSNEYKSQFLANMSHELRTPLNSSLILAKLLADNRERNLTAEQIQFAQTIYSAGNDLLTLINDILDLSKIEAGMLEVRPESIALSRVAEELRGTFQPLASQKQLRLEVRIADDAPAAVETDHTRLLQILKNLVSNALKFTEQGGVTIEISPHGQRIAFAVRDTGIGIEPSQHELIFEAFRQADGASTRKFGGTGLGLSISRDLARLLGGDLVVDSAPGRGSTFTLLVPPRSSAQTAPVMPAPISRPERVRKPKPQALAAGPFLDDRANVTVGSRALLIVEDDAAFARVLYDLAHELEFLAIVATTAEDGLALARDFAVSAIILDVGLPDRSGLAVLDTLKRDPRTRHVPVHVVSATDYTRTALEMGAAGYGLKPVERGELVDAIKRLESKFTQKLRRVLIVEDDPVLRDSTARLLGGTDVETVTAGTSADALSKLAAQTFDCMVLDLSLPDRTGLELLEEMARGEQYSFPPVIVYTGRSLSTQEVHELERFSRSIIIKGARSPERLLDEVTLFLHQVESELPPERQRMLRDARDREAVFEGRRILVVEDDVRNVFALTAVLEPKGAQIEIARNGREALDKLCAEPVVDLVLMDIMMPEMDGLEATRQLRADPRFARIPIIALTAKAMIDDRERCLAAGANDYIAKPLDVDKLLSLARVWIRK